MASRFYEYRRDWHLQSAPADIWTFIANTHRLNYYASSPAVADALAPGERLPNAYRLLRAVVTEFEEAPFNWVKPHQFNSTRKFTKFRIFDELKSGVQLEETAEGGTLVHYSISGSAAYLFMRPFVPLLLRRIVNAFDKPLRDYDRALQHNPARPELEMQPKKVRVPIGSTSRLTALSQELAASLKNFSIDPQVARQLQTLLTTADDIDLARMRPYVLASHWGIPERTALETCLLATRVGLLEMRWELLCPMCRSQKDSAENLKDIEQHAHCETCNITFDANFSQSVELVFRPSPALRQTEPHDFCVHGPELTPHVMVQHLLSPGETRQFALSLEQGNYRGRAMELAGAQPLVVHPDGQVALTLAITANGWDANALDLAPQFELTVQNQTTDEQLFILERTLWTEQAVTGAQVIALQTFRDLFAEEALQVGRQIEVGVQTILFTDIRSSTQMYRELGDAVAFANVLDYFDILRTIIREEQGAIVKTIGDAVMGVFQQPGDALRALLRARQKLLAIEPSLAVKAGIHTGPCIAVNLNGRMDYFGTTVNLASRLESLCRPNGFVISDSTHSDPTVAQELTVHPGISVEQELIELRGFEGDQQVVWHILDHKQ